VVGVRERKFRGGRRPKGSRYEAHADENTRMTGAAQRKGTNKRTAVDLKTPKKNQK